MGVNKGELGVDLGQGEGVEGEHESYFRACRLRCQEGGNVWMRGEEVQGDCG